MKVENQRDEAIKQEKKAQEDLTQVKLELQRKESEVADWKNIASKQRNEVGYTALPNAYDLTFRNTDTSLREVSDIINRVMYKARNI